MEVTLLPQLLAPRIKTNNSQTQYNAFSNKLTSLRQDAVSFGQSPGNSIADVISDNYDKEIKSKEFKEDATNYLRSLNTVVTKLSKKGYSWNKDEAVKHIIKSLDSYLSKIGRSGSLVVPDKIRATVYNTNVRNLSSLVNDLLPAMEEEGYVLAPVKMSVKDLMKRGYIPTDKEKARPTTMKEVKDLDIRLKDVMDQLSVLPEDLRYSIGKPQDSGYEDIQMRFIKKKDIGKKNPRTFELLVLSGPAMEEAKIDESAFVYNNTRKFKLITDKYNKAESNSDEARVLNYIELIKRMFEKNISTKLFTNARNKDANNNVEEDPIYFSEKDIQQLNNYFYCLKKRLSNIHAKAIKEAVGTDVNIIDLKKAHRSEFAAINEIKKDLFATVEHYSMLNEISE